MSEDATVTELATARETAADRRAYPDFTDVAHALADELGVCRRPLPMRVYDTDTHTSKVVGAPCKSTLSSACPACADRNRRLRIQQCREGWHLDVEPVRVTNEPTELQKALVLARVDLFAEFQTAKEDSDTDLMAGIREVVTDLDEELRSTGFRKRLPALDAQAAKPRRVRSTKRRQDAPNLPKRPRSRRTIGTEYAGKFRPSMMITLTMPSYGRINSDGATDEKGHVCGDGSPVDPDHYDYRRAARDTVHFKSLIDVFIENLRRVAGWNIQYYGVVEPQRRGAPHIHILIRGTVPREIVKQVAAATYYQVWWPHHDRQEYGGDRMPVWDYKTGTFVDPDTRHRLHTFEEALDIIDSADDVEPAHVVWLGSQIDPKDIRGVLGNSEEAGRHIGYVTKYLTKAVGEILEPPNQRTADHYDRLHAELQRTPCCEECEVWLLYGIVPKGANEKTVPGRCKRTAHRRNLLGVPGRRVLNSRQWTGKTLPDHKADRIEFVRQLLAKVGILKPDTSHLKITPTRPGDKDVPPRDHLIMGELARRRAWQAEWKIAQLADASPPGAQDSSTIPEAA